MAQGSDLLGDAAARLDALTARVESLMGRQAAARAAAAAPSAEQVALLAELMQLRADNDALRAALAEIESAREADFAMRTEAAEALDRAIAELRSMADAR